MATDVRLKEQLPELTRRIVETYQDVPTIHYLGHCPLPNYDAIIAACEDLKEILYPGYRRRENLHLGNVTYHVGDLVDGLHDKLTKQIGRDTIALAAKLATGPAVAEGWTGYALLHNAAARVGGIDIGFVPGKGGVCSLDQLGLARKDELDVLFLLGADEYDLDYTGKTFIVYIGTHGDKGAHKADVILPGATYTEKSGTYVNTEGRVQMAERATFPPGDAKEDWAIFRALSAVLGVALPYDSLSQLRAKLYGEFPHLAALDQIAPAKLDDIRALAKAPIKTKIATYSSTVADFYLTNPIARASAVMGECAALSAGLKQAAE
jgi:NADH-quinone oxidoreductase subunit G